MVYDIAIEGTISVVFLEKIFSHIFKMSKNNFFIFEGPVSDHIDDNGNFTLDFKDGDERNLCQKLNQGGDFKTQIELNIRHNDQWSSELIVAQMVSSYLDCRCLIGSEEINPYHWIVVHADGTHKPIFVDRVRLDDHHEFVIKSDA